MDWLVFLITLIVLSIFYFPQVTRSMRSTSENLFVPSARKKAMQLGLGERSGGLLVDVNFFPVEIIFKGYWLEMEMKG